jgi:hypothetical protein
MHSSLSLLTFNGFIITSCLSKDNEKMQYLDVLCRKALLFTGQSASSNRKAPPHFRMAMLFWGNTIILLKDVGVKRYFAP